MKRRNIFFFLFSAGFLVFAITCFAESYYRLLFERGLHTMEETNDPQTAIPIFQEIVKRHAHDRGYAARSQFYIGLCYKRMGSKEAYLAFREVISNFQDQKEIVRAAEAELSFLPNPSAPAPAESGEKIKRRIWKDQSVCCTGTVSNDGRYFSFIDLESGDLLLYETAVGITHRLTHFELEGTFEKFAASPKFSPDSRQIAFGLKDKKERSELQLVDVDGSGNRALYLDPGIVSIHPAGWTEDGRQILSSLTRKDLTTQVVFVSVSDGSVQPIVEMGHRWPDRLSLSPDGRYLAYSLPQNEDGPERDIYLYSIEEKKEIPLVVQKGDDLLMDWTPDGRSIFFTNSRAGKTDAWILPIEEGKPQEQKKMIHSDIGPIDPVGFTENGTYYYSRSNGKNTDPNAAFSSTELWSLADFLPEEKKRWVVPDDYPNIQAAVSAAQPADIVYVRQGTYSENIIISKPLTLQGEDRETTIIDGGGNVDAVNITASNVSVSGFTVKNGTSGIVFVSELPIHHVTLKDLIVTSHVFAGIYSLNSGGYHVIEDCVVSNNDYRGFLVHQFSRSIIRNCKVFENPVGIMLGWSWHASLEGNQVHHNREEGIVMDSCYFSTAKKNLIYANIGSGISFVYISSRNTIEENIIFNNHVGICDNLRWDGFGEHRIYHNDIFNNKKQISGHKNSLNFQYWDNGYPSGGNHWSDYSGQDANHDGIGDTHYVLPEEARDHFPLVKPRNRIQAVVAAKPDGLSSDSRDGWLTVYVELPAGLPANDIDISTLRLNGAVSPEKKQISVGDYDSDGIPDIMMKFSRQSLTRILQPGQDIELILSGSLENGPPFEGRFLPNSGGK